jgi:hypothetical protein
VHEPDRLADIRLPGHHRDIEIWMCRDEAQNLTAGVSAGTGNGDPGSHVHDYASCRKFMQTVGFSPNCR